MNVQEYWNMGLENYCNNHLSSFLYSWLQGQICLQYPLYRISVKISPVYFVAFCHDMILIILLMNAHRNQG